VLLFKAGCRQWTVEPNTNYANGQANGATSVQLCQTACIGTAECNGFDWVPTDPVGRQCWLSGPWSSGRGTTQGVTHYVLDRSCAGKFTTL